VGVQVVFEHQAEACRKQMWRSVAAFAPINETFAGVEVDISDLDVDELAHAYNRIEEQFLRKISCCTSSQSWMARKNGFRSAPASN
jgi:hypothetical protein